MSNSNLKELVIFTNWVQQKDRRKKQANFWHSTVRIQAENVKRLNWDAGRILFRRTFLRHRKRPEVCQSL